MVLCHTFMVTNMERNGFRHLTEAWRNVDTCQACLLFMSVTRAQRWFVLSSSKCWLEVSKYWSCDMSGMLSSKYAWYPGVVTSCDEKRISDVLRKLQKLQEANPDFTWDFRSVIIWNVLSIWLPIDLLCRGSAHVSSPAHRSWKLNSKQDELSGEHLSSLCTLESFMQLQTGEQTLRMEVRSHSGAFKGLMSQDGFMLRALRYGWTASNQIVITVLLRGTYLQNYNHQKLEAQSFSSDPSDLAVCQSWLGLFTFVCKQCATLSCGRAWPGMVMFSASRFRPCAWQCGGSNACFIREIWPMNIKLISHCELHVSIAAASVTRIFIIIHGPLRQVQLQPQDVIHSACIASGCKLQTCTDQSIEGLLVTTHVPNLMRTL